MVGKPLAQLMEEAGALQLVVLLHIVHLSLHGQPTVEAVLHGHAYGEAAARVVMAVVIVTRLRGQRVI